MYKNNKPKVKTVSIFIDQLIIDGKLQNGTKRLDRTKRIKANFSLSQSLPSREGRL